MGAHAAAAQMTNQQLYPFPRVSHTAFQRDSLDAGPTVRAKRAPFFNRMSKITIVIWGLFSVALAWLVLLLTLLPEEASQYEVIPLDSICGVRMAVLSKAVRDECIPAKPPVVRHRRAGGGADLGFQVGALALGVSLC